MKQPMIANRSMTYGTRRLAADDEFTATRQDARLLQALGRARAAEAKARPKPQAADEELAGLRAEYQDRMGKRAYHGWDAETLRAKMAEAGED